MQDLTQQQIDELTAEEYACFLSTGCVIENHPEIPDLSEEELDHYLRTYREYDL